MLEKRGQRRCSGERFAAVLLLLRRGGRWPGRAVDVLPAAELLPDAGAETEGEEDEEDMEGYIVGVVCLFSSCPFFCCGGPAARQRRRLKIGSERFVMMWK